MEKIERGFCGKASLQFHKNHTNCVFWGVRPKLFWTKGRLVREHIKKVSPTGDAKFSSDNLIEKKETDLFHENWLRKLRNQKLLHTLPFMASRDLEARIEGKTYSLKDSLQTGRYQVRLCSTKPTPYISKAPRSKKI